VEEKEEKVVIGRDSLMYVCFFFLKKLDLSMYHTTFLQLTVVCKITL